MKLSLHSKTRIRERTDFDTKERKTLFKNALKLGKSIQDIKSERIRKYMQDRSCKCKIKLYKGYLFLYSKNKHILYTMYKLPEELEEDANE